MQEEPKKRKKSKKEPEPVIKGPNAAELRRQRREFLRAERWRREHKWRSRKWLVPVNIMKLHETLRERVSKSVEVFDRIDINNFREERKAPKVPIITFSEGEASLELKEELEEIDDVFSKYMLGKGDKLAEDSFVLENIEDDAKMLDLKSEKLDCSLMSFDKKDNYLKTQFTRVALAKVIF